MMEKGVQREFLFTFVFDENWIVCAVQIDRTLVLFTLDQAWLGPRLCSM